MKKSGLRGTAGETSNPAARATRSRSIASAAMETTGDTRSAAWAEPGRKASAALVLGIVSLVTGFLAVPLLAAVAAITLASLALQDIDAGLTPPSRRGNAVAGMVCAIAALCIWIPVFVALAIAES